VENKTDTHGLDGPGDYSDGEQWQDTIHLLRLVQSDYQGARKQLEQASNTLAEREALVSQRLQYALLASGGYRALQRTKWAKPSSAELFSTVLYPG